MFGHANAHLELIGEVGSAGLGVVGPLTGDAPTTAPDISLFDPAKVKGLYELDGVLRFDITSISTAGTSPGAPVPEPSAALLFAVGALVVGGSVRKRPAA